MIPLVMSVIAKTETFQRDMAKAGASVNKFSTTASRTTATVTKMGRSLLMMAGIGGGLYMLTRGIRGAISAGLEQEKVERQLTAAIGGNISAMKMYAAEMQKQTIYGDELILSQMAYGKNLGINTEQLEAATTAAIGLAAKYRLELNSAMMLVGRAALGQTQMLTRYGIVLDETLGPQEKFSALLKIGAENFHLAIAETETAAGAIAQFKNAIGDLSESLAEPFLPGITDRLKEITAWAQAGDFEAGIHDRIALVYEFGDAITNLDELFKIYSPKWDKTYAELAAEHRLLADVARANAELNTRAPQLPQKQQPQWSDEGVSDEDLWLSSMPGDAVVDNAEVNKQILDDTREHLTSIRSMHDKTRMEKIQILEDYRMAHFGHTEEIEAAEQLLKDEILSLQKSRVDAMKVYNAELREDMQDSALYISEQFASAARSIEGSMSSAFQSMISGGASWKEAMRQFFLDVGNAFAKMASDMAARTLMAGVMGGGGETAAAALTVAGASAATAITTASVAMTSTFMAAGTTVSAAITAAGAAAAAAIAAANLGSGIGSLHTGWVPAGASSFHNGWVPTSMPSFHGGRSMKSNEMVALIEKDEMIVPNKQIVKGISSANYEPKFNIIIVRDEKAAQIEAMNSKEGEKSYIRHASRNRNI